MHSVAGSHGTLGCRPRRETCRGQVEVDSHPAAVDEEVKPLEAGAVPHPAGLKSKSGNSSKIQNEQKFLGKLGQKLRRRKGAT